MATKFSGILRKTRKALDLTQPELADKLGVSKQSITRWESGGGTPRDSAEYIAKLDKLSGPIETTTIARAPKKKNGLLDQVIANVSNAVLTVTLGEKQIQFGLDTELAQSLVRKELAN